MPRNFMCRWTEQPCVEEDCNLEGDSKSARCVQHERDKAAFAHARARARRWREAHPEYLTDDDLEDMGLLLSMAHISPTATLARFVPIEPGNHP
jgi:hypothetical protein